MNKFIKHLPLADFPDLSFSIDAKADALFAGWLAVMKQQEPHRLNPDTINDYTPANTSHDIRCFLLDIWKGIAEADAEKRNDEAACIGQLKYALTNTIRFRWSMQFLVVNKPRKVAHWLTAMIMQLDENPEIRTEINRTCQYILENEFTDFTDDEPTEEDEEEMQSIFLLADLQADENWELVKAFLEYTQRTMIGMGIDTQKDIDLDNIENYFTASEFKELVNLNPYL